MLITYLIVGFTALISFMAFNSPELVYRLKHWPSQESRTGEYYRWVSCAFVHADPGHLIFNMITLYFFGPIVEDWFVGEFPTFSSTLYLLFYLAAAAAASSGTYYRNRNRSSFASIGASGAVAGILFASIAIHPAIGINLFFIPIPIPGFIFGPLYLWYSTWASRQNQGNIDHLAHFYGAIFGFFIPILLSPDTLPNAANELFLWWRQFSS